MTIPENYEQLEKKGFKLYYLESRISYSDLRELESIRGSLIGSVATESSAAGETKMADKVTLARNLTSKGGKESGM